MSLVSHSQQVQLSLPHQLRSSVSRTFDVAFATAGGTRPVDAIVQREPARPQDRVAPVVDSAHVTDLHVVDTSDSHLEAVTEGRSVHDSAHVVVPLEAAPAVLVVERLVGLVEPQPRTVTHARVAFRPVDTDGVDSVDSAVDCSAVGRALAEVTDVQHAVGTAVHMVVCSPARLVHHGIADHTVVSSEDRVRVVDTHHDDTDR